MQAIVIKPWKSEGSIDEKLALVRAAGYETEEIIAVKKDRYPIGSGKLKEISEKEPGTIIFLSPLTPSQKRSLHNRTNKEIIDFYDLVLKVFEYHALSREAKVQIELARLRRDMPYIKKEVSVNVKKEHPGFSGGGEYIIHSHLTNMKKREAKLERELQLYEVRKESERKKRRNIVSLAGYTNSGKSTLFNALSHGRQPTKNEPFTTLQTKSRKAFLDGRNVVMNDTIGFISDLPTELIAPFRVTLRDIVESDVILLVIDSSESIATIRSKMEVCLSNLREIGMDRSRSVLITVLNKIDLLQEQSVEEVVKGAQIEWPFIAVSALEGLGMEELKKIISSSLPVE